jgi:hypothetical protein
MYKFLFFIFICLQCYGQKVHHQVIASQGVNAKISTDIIVSQSIGQVNAVVGNYKNPKLIIGQGYIQSIGVAKNASPVNEVVSMVQYPNPVIDLANFQFSSTIGTSVNFYLFDSRGRLVYSKEAELTQNNFAIDLSMVSEGVYFAKIETSNYTFSTKILKSK